MERRRGACVLEGSAATPVVRAMLEGEHVFLAEISWLLPHTAFPANKCQDPGEFRLDQPGSTRHAAQLKTPLTTFASVTRVSVSDSGLLW